MQLERPLIAKKNSHIRIMAALGFMSALAPLSIDMYLPAMPEMAAQLNASDSSVQASLAVFLLGLAIGQLLAGPVSDARGRRDPMMISMGIYITASLLCAFSPSIEVLLVLRFIQGLSGAAGIVIARAIVRDLYDGPELTRFFALLTAIGGLGLIVAPLAGGLLLQIMNWNGIFIVLALLGAVMLLSAYVSVPESLPPSYRITGGLGTSLTTMKGLLLDRSLVGYSITQGLITGGLFSYISGSPFVLQNVYGVSPQICSLLFALNGSGFIIGARLTAKLTAVFSEKSLLLFGLCHSSVNGLFLLAAFLMKWHLAFVIIPMFFIVSSVGIIATTCMSLALQKHKKSAGSAAGILGVISMLFGAAISSMVGLGGSVSVLSMGLVIAFCSLGALVCYMFLVRRKEMEAK
jgi:DHA1 family bicyclomycin/chloramphenicol resistance-like MFS transporter